MQRCASSRVVAAYVKVGLTPRESRALPMALFTAPFHNQHFLYVLKLIMLNRKENHLPNLLDFTWRKWRHSSPLWAKKNFARGK